MGVTTRGERELALRFDTFPSRARSKLQERIRALTDEMEGQAQALAPSRTGTLRSEIIERVFSDQPTRVAGYVSVYAPGNPGEYPKAGALEYGVNKVRKLRARMDEGRRRLAARASAPVHQKAFRYLRGAFDTVRSQATAELAQALDEATGDDPA